MQVEYEGQTYETEPSGEAHCCKNCGKEMRENKNQQFIRREKEEERPTSETFLINGREERPQISSYKTIKYEKGCMLYSRTYGYEGNGFFCTRLCGYKWAYRLLQTREMLANANTAEHQRTISEQ